MIIAKEQKTIEDQILSRFGKHIEIDIDMFSEEIFLDDIIKRFYSKKIYGSGKDFSLSELVKILYLILVKMMYYHIEKNFV